MSGEGKCTPLFAFLDGIFSGPYQVWTGLHPFPNESAERDDEDKILLLMLFIWLPHVALTPIANFPNH